MHDQRTAARFICPASDIVYLAISYYLKDPSLANGVNEGVIRTIDVKKQGVPATTKGLKSAFINRSLLANW